jgi:lipoprotein-anchoring transpeptidase ErfK/SrfK
MKILKLRGFLRSTFPEFSELGRVVWWGTELKTRPSTESQTIRKLPEDEVLPWLQVVVGSNSFHTNQNWVETTDGYIWESHLQPVRDQLNQPAENLPETSLGSGMWVEVSVPYVNLVLDNPPARSPWLSDRLEYNVAPRLYFSQVLWVDQIQITQASNVLYRIKEPYGSYGDIFWAAADAFRPIPSNEIIPINPGEENKRIVVNIAQQTLQCFEDQREVYFCRVSTGALYNASGEKVDAWATPVGKHPIWRKLVSLHMSGGTTGGGWDLPGVGWTTLFIGSGIAVHSTFWHNNFGVPMSRGCVNTRPEDAKWIFRWTQPSVEYDPGDVTVEWPGGTKVEVVES